MNKNIFIIDSDANSLFSLKSRLSEAGFNVKADHSFYDIKRITENLGQFKTEVLIFDIDHSHWNWIELLHDIRKEENLKNICLIVYTANEEANIQKKVKNNGVDYFFSKNDLMLDQFIKKILNIYNKILKK